MVVGIVTRPTQPPTARGPIRPREDLFAPEHKPEPVNLARVGRQGGGPSIPRAVTVGPPVVPERAPTTVRGATGATSQSTTTPMTPMIPLQRQGIVIPLPALFLGPGDGQNGVTYQPAPISNLTPEQAFKMVSPTSAARWTPSLLGSGRIRCYWRPARSTASAPWPSAYTICKTWPGITKKSERPPESQRQDGLVPDRPGGSDPGREAILKVGRRTSTAGHEGPAERPARRSAETEESVTRPRG
jgi:hypothetical protein